jgi:hypothetical protein
MKYLHKNPGKQMFAKQSYVAVTLPIEECRKKGRRLIIYPIENKFEEICDLLGIMEGLVFVSLLRGTAGTALFPLQSQTSSPLPLALFNFCDGLVLGNDDDIFGSYFRKNSRGFSGILASSTDLVAVFPEEEGKGNAG